MKSILFVLFFAASAVHAQSTVAPVVNPSTGQMTGVAQTYGGQTVIIDNNGNVRGVIINPTPPPAPYVPRDPNAPTNSSGQPIPPPVGK